VTKIEVRVVPQGRGRPLTELASVKHSLKNPVKLRSVVDK